MSLSPTGRKLESDQEGLVLHAYDDAGGAGAVLHYDAANARYLDRNGNRPRGNPTIGVGHLIRPGEVFGAITEERAWDLFDHDSAKVLTKARDVFEPGMVTPHRLDALMDFGLNCGEGTFDHLAPLVNAGDDEGATAYMLEFVHGMVDGKKVVLPVLQRRRRIEVALYLDPMPAALSTEDVATTLGRVYQTSWDEIGEEENEHGRPNDDFDGGDGVGSGA